MKIAESYSRALERMVRDVSPYLSGREYGISFMRDSQGLIEVHFKIEGCIQDPEPGLMEFLDVHRKAIEQYGLTIVYMKSGRRYVEYETISKFRSVEELLGVNGLLMQVSVYSMMSDIDASPKKEGVLARCAKRVARWFGLAHK